MAARTQAWEQFGLPSVLAFGPLQLAAVLGEFRGMDVAGHNEAGAFGAEAAGPHGFWADLAADRRRLPTPTGGVGTLTNETTFG